KKEKKREKKRENLEIQHCFPILIHRLQASRRLVGRIFSDRGEKEQRTGFSPRLRREISSPSAGRRNVSSHEEKE
ncbi:hypothetical protein GW17_00038146, partial [Ensete ventricosum]